MLNLTEALVLILFVCVVKCRRCKLFSCDPSIHGSDLYGGM